MELLARIQMGTQICFVAVLLCILAQSHNSECLERLLVKDDQKESRFVPYV